MFGTHTMLTHIQKSSHQEHSSALKPKAYITLSASQRVKLSEKRPETLSYETVRTTVMLATKKKLLHVLQIL